MGWIQGFIYPYLRYLQKKFGKKSGRMSYEPMYEPTDENVFEVVRRYLDQWKYF